MSFIRKKPEHLPELIHKIREVLTFDWTDERFGFERQNILFKILIKGLAKKDVLYSTAFYELSKHFLLLNTNKQKAKDISNIFLSVSHSQQPVDRLFRKNIWNNVNDYFSVFPEESLELLQSYANVSPDVIKEIMEYDIQLLIPIIKII